MKNISKILPIMFAYYVMGFSDITGIATSYIKKDFGLSETLAGFIPAMVFIWFLLISIPTAMMLNRFGRKRIVQFSSVVTFTAMVIPFCSYSFASCMAAFVLLGIGNTILQVSLNPLLASVVKGDSVASSLTAGQVVKAVSAFCAPLIALFAVQYLGNWQYLFPIYACITFISWLWLALTPIPEDNSSETPSTGLLQTLSLLGDREILLCFIGIFCVVGIDIGTNTVSVKLMIERAGWVVSKAGVAASVYFLCRTAGALLGSVLLTKVRELVYIIINIFCTLFCVAALFWVHNPVAILVLVGLIGFFCSSIFPAIFTIALKARPDKTNEVSGFMIMGICGGAVIPPLMGILADAVGNQCGSLIVVAVCTLYICGYAALKLKRR